MINYLEKIYITVFYILHKTLSPNGFPNYRHAHAHAHIHTTFLKIVTHRK